VKFLQKEGKKGGIFSQGEKESAGRSRREGRKRERVSSFMSAFMHWKETKEVLWRSQKKNRSESASSEGRKGKRKPLIDKRDGRRPFYSTCPEEEREKGRSGLAQSESREANLGERKGGEETLILSPQKRGKKRKKRHNVELVFP